MKIAMKHLLPILCLLIAGLACQKPATKETEVPRNSNTNSERKLIADVRLSTSGITIKNTDVGDLGSLTVKLNLTQLGGNDGVATAGGLAKGKSMTIPYGEFTVGTKRFNPRDTKILTIYVKSSDGSAKLFICPGSQCQPT